MGAIVKTAGVLVACMLSSVLNYHVFGFSAAASLFSIPVTLSLIALHRTFQEPRP